MGMTAVKRLTAKGLHSAYDLDVTLFPGLNVIHGKNGTGKTTALHIIANILDRDIERFTHMQFREITLQTFNNDTIQLVRLSPKIPRVEVYVNGDLVSTKRSDQEVSIEVDLHLGRVLGEETPVYLPAFRSVLEAINRNGREAVMRTGLGESHRAIEKLAKQLAERSTRLIQTRRQPRAPREDVWFTAHKTTMCREWFGQHVPVIRYPSLWEVADNLSFEMQSAFVEVSSAEQSSIETVFHRVLEAVLSPSADVSTEPPANSLQRLRSNLADQSTQMGQQGTLYFRLAQLVEANRQRSDISATIAAVLSVYADAMEARKTGRDRAFETLNRFLQSVNSFLENKKVTVEAMSERSRSSAYVRGTDGTRHSLGVLSSGERHILTLLFCATHMSAADGVVLIDEPELSLHIDWQRVILSRLESLADGRQIVVCTHAPEVAAEHRDRLVPLDVRPTSGYELLWDDDVSEFDSEGSDL